MILIVGSGVSSLAFAEKCRMANKDFMIVEKDKFGGKARTYASNSGLARFDIAGHFLHYPDRSPEVAGTVFDFPVRERIAKVWFDNELFDYPIQKSLEERGIVFRENRAISWNDYPEESMTAYFVDKFGELAWHFFVPYNRKVWAVSTDRLEQDHYEKFRSPVKGLGYNSSFVYPDLGAMDIPKKIGRNVESIISKGEVIAIDPVRKVARIKVGNAITVVEYETLVSPMPLPDLCSMTSGYQNMKEGLGWSSVLIFNIAYKKFTDKFDGVSWLYVPSHEYEFFRCGWYSHVSPQMAAKGYESMYIEVSYPGELDGKIDKNNVLSNVLRDLKRLGICDTNSLVDISPVVVEKAYPLSIDRKSDRVAMIKNAFEANSIYPVGRYGLWRWSGMYSDMSYAEKLFDYIYSDGDKPSLTHGG